MSDKKSRLLDDEAIGLLQSRKISVAVGVSTSKLSKERERVTRYYNAELPRPQHAGQSSYVSSDVYDAVEAMKADLLETFSGSQDIVKFAPQGPDDTEACRIATEYASYLVFRQNPGYHILHDVIDDALKARVGIVKVFWNEDVSYEDEDFENLLPEEAEALVAQDDVHEFDADLQEDGTYKGSLTRKTDKGKVAIENVPPEHFGIDPWAKKLNGSFHYQRELMTEDQIKANGWDCDKLKDVSPAQQEYLTQELETQARFNQIDSGYRPEDQEEQPEMKRWEVYECVDTFIKYKGDRPRLYKVVVVNKTVLACEEIQRSPFKVYSALRMAHMFWGNSFAARVIPTQNARTVLTRGILDHTSITNNPRYTVLQGGLSNPREMLDNRLGGIVNISRPEAVQPLQQASLNPFVFQTLATLKENAEEMTGVSSLAQGLNKDAISSQNSQGMVNDLVNLSKQRQKIVARNLAEFIAELYIEVYMLACERDSKQSFIEIAGNWVDIDPRTWKERKNYTIKLTLTQSEANQEAADLMQIMAAAKQDPFLQRSMGDQGTYNLASDIFALKGHKNFARYFQPPEKTPPAQPDPEQQKMQLENQKLQLQGQELQAHVQEAGAKAQAEQAKAQAEMQRTQHEQEVAASDQEQAQTELQLKIADSHRKDMDVANRIDVSQRELQIVEKAPPAELSAIAAPRG